MGLSIKGVGGNDFFEDKDVKQKKFNEDKESSIFLLNSNGENPEKVDDLYKILSKFSDSEAKDKISQESCDEETLLEEKEKLEKQREFDERIINLYMMLSETTDYEEQAERFYQSKD